MYIVHYPVPDLKKFVKIFAPSQNMIDLCKKMTHAKYFFCNAKIATVQALQSFQNVQNTLFLGLF